MIAGLPKVLFLPLGLLVVRRFIVLVCDFKSRLHLPSLCVQSRLCRSAVSLNEAEVDSSGNGELDSSR